MKNSSLVARPSQRRVFTWQIDAKEIAWSPMTLSLIMHSHLLPSDRSLIERAFHVASMAHEQQKRDSGEPYITHPLRVAEHLARLGMDGPTIAAALLHDTLEDTPMTKQELTKEFGDEVAFLVEGVTKLESIPYKSSHEVRTSEDIYVASLKKMLFAMAQDIRVMIIKIADRYHNIETLSSLDPESQRRIALETLEIYAPIADRLGMGNLKGQLEDMCFPYVYPHEFKTLVTSSKIQYRDHLKYIEHAKPIVAQHLKSSHITILDIHSRAKRAYSLFQKLKKYHMDMDRVFDLVALRIIVPDIKSCYEALGVIHAHYRPLPGRIKDFIATPKPNGYQSLHTTVFCEKGRIARQHTRGFMD
jgi:GTP pyrophosphokinase